MDNDRLLTEIERQQKYLAELPADFQFPLFNSRQALESQRRNGYRNTAAAAREIVDNAMEAGATKIHIVFDRPRKSKAHERQDSVSAVAFIDNGAGMLEKMARFALSWGGGTHSKDHDFIGRFGFGLPNASINQTRIVEVYTRTNVKEKFTKAWLDIGKVPVHGMQSIEEPIKADLPDFVQKYLKDNDLDLQHGTVVVWVKPDRLTYRMAASLKEHLVDDFGVTYRYLLRGDETLKKIELKVEGVELEPVDPLFLDPRSRFYVPEEKGGAQPVFSESKIIPVKYFRDSETGALRASKVEQEAEVDVQDPDLLALGTIHIQVARFPVGFVAEGKSASTDARRRFEIRKTRRGMSFVRAGREIDTVDAFPRSPRDIANNLGTWPLLQSYAYHWGVEVKFDPSLDDVFGITNDKQTVRPIEDFWKILAKEDLDKTLNRENQYQRAKRDHTKPRAEATEGPSPAETAAAAADTVTGRKPSVPDNRKTEAKATLTEEAKRKVAINGKSIEETLKAIEQDSKHRPYKIDYFDDIAGPFYEPKWVGTQLLVSINRKHPFYETLYGELLRLSGGVRAKEAIDVLLIALSRGELTVDDETAQLWYKTQREDMWSKFLMKALTVLAQTLRPTEDQTDDVESAA